LCPTTWSNIAIYSSTVHPTVSGTRALVLNRLHKEKKGALLILNMEIYSTSVEL
jgi:hypothetical protein